MYVIFGINTIILFIIKKTLGNWKVMLQQPLTCSSSFMLPTCFPHSPPHSPNCGSHRCEPVWPSLTAGKQNDFGSIHFGYFFLLKSCDLWSRSVKARWERWCRWNCDLRVINVRKKGIFCRTENLAMTPKSRDHMPTTSLWGVAAKWQTRAPKTKLTLCPREPQGYSCISLSLSGRILKEYRNIVSASTCGLRNRSYWSARYTNGRDAALQESQLVWIV